MQHRTNRVMINLTAPELAVLTTLSEKQGLSRSMVMVQALRQYQMVVEGHANLTIKQDLSKKERVEGCTQ